ncbi:OmpH family outer membrane protein [Maribacter arcticus]|jgi:outer membrane protein|uniref:Periplasmic chaperone for outer membrane proteins Skp n=2 Tax=Maribacter arcticus TaxID=561365 RepID=A0A1T5ATN8_9FLAO|nr:OmpH family outer membrane protein [Maribacter arcticus]SKB38392.1 periplasmic chaperone for outer membrane proteins Skp [Maribacter arcticus]|tara:strand:+ start:89 stop:598 length:510 start_codon:yes stop_codon:yes gene_type:complete
MKQVKQIVVALLLFVATTSFVNAQSKVAHIDVTQLLSAMPEMKAAEAELKKLQETYNADIQASMTELRNKFTQYQNEAAAKSKEENDKRAVELQGFEKNIGEAQQAAQQEFQKKQAELFAPISEKAKTAIEKVAAAQGFDYVMDAQAGGGLIVAKGKDLLADVKKQLGF